MTLQNQPLGGDRRFIPARPALRVAMGLVASAGAFALGALVFGPHSDARSLRLAGLQGAAAHPTKTAAAAAPRGADRAAARATVPVPATVVAAAIPTGDGVP
jgi:hypothetical protein